MEVSLSMVQKTTDKFTDQRLFSSRNVTTASDMHYPISINRMSLSELPNESGGIMKSPLGSVQPIKVQDNSDSANLVGNKRQQGECSSTPPARNQALATNGSTGHLVYVRRKPETEHGKTNTTSNGEIACSSGLRKFSIEASSKTETQQEQTTKPEDQNKAAEEAPSLLESQKEITNYWTERFNRLQDRLQYLDKLGSKNYAERFRNFSIEELNKHAIELEKRAIHLSLEEVLQSNRVKDLNLLGKSS
ncbi:uncharacterized protein LOC110097701 isoform X1 [Dendrobium catenatum]|uniref:Uncharacterized protein n=2 Tax=Dendrobium catenatum TaxID=906689 RepID=A0A2I0WPS4_9ASPA|nr:uncharacterized protein LOC110097701 isoform X1 [Dendrobium catenatum]PKU77667.1 hypothetical protein MA16_Dca013459 [Dendrobium catenatum]